MFYKPINNSINVGGHFTKHHESTTKFSIPNGFQTPATLEFRSTSKASTCGKKENATNLLMPSSKSQMYEIGLHFRIHLKIISPNKFISF